MNFIYNNPKFKFRRRELRGKQTDAEGVLWKKLRDRQILGLKFFRQYSVGPCVLDFYCPQVRLAIELDGRQHDEAAQKIYDSERTGYLNGNDIKILRFRNCDIFSNINVVLKELNLQLYRLYAEERIAPSLKVREGARG